MRYFDLHCDTITECAMRGVSLCKNDLHINLESAKKYERWAQVFAVWMPDKLRGEDALRRFDKVYSTYLTELEKNKDSICFCRNGADMVKAFDSGKNAAFLSIEGGAALAGNIDNLFKAYEKGVRVITLTWNGACELGDGCMTPSAGGLTPFGREVVRQMAKLRMIVDVSHLSEQGFYDVAQETDAAFIASHSNAMAVCAHPRNLTDEQIKEIIHRGGLIGLNLYPDFINQGGGAMLADLLPHAEHILSLGGEKVLAIGADFDGADMPDDVSGIEDMDKLESLLTKIVHKSQADRALFGNASDFFRKL